MLTLTTTRLLQNDNILWIEHFSAQQNRFPTIGRLYDLWQLVNLLGNSARQRKRSTFRNQPNFLGNLYRRRLYPFLFLLFGCGIFLEMQINVSFERVPIGVRFVTRGTRVRLLACRSGVCLGVKNHVS